MFGSSQDFFDYLDQPSEEAKEAFLIIQDEMFHTIRTCSMTGKRPTAVEFGQTCSESLKNSLPDNWIEANEAAINSMADAFFERWQAVLNKTRMTQSPEQPDRLAP